MKKRIAIVTTHPIQYNAPLFRLLHMEQQFEIEVFYTWGAAVIEKKFDPGFGKTIAWDLPLLDGYPSHFEYNKARRPGSHHFLGIDNPGLVKNLSNWRPDAVLVYGWNFKSHLKVLRYFHKKIPVLFRGDSNLLKNSNGIKSIARTFFLRWVYRHVDYALYVGKNNKDYFLNCGLKENQLLYAPHAVDNAFFADEEDRFTAEAKEYRRKLGFEDEDIVLLFAGKLEPVKNVFYLLDLMTWLPNDNLKLLIVGNGMLRDELKAKAAADKRIVFLDFQNQSKMPVIYRIGDLFILPSFSETWGLSLNEAMACSRPIMASDKVGAAVDLIHHEKNGIIFSHSEKEPVTSFLAKVLTNKAELLKMGNYSKQLISTFNYKRFSEALHFLNN